METRARMESRVTLGEAAGMWWLFLITGVAWLLVSVIVLRFDITSIASVGALLGVVFIAAGANEFMVMVMRNMTWRWLHGALGVIFIAGGIWAFIHPIGAFYELAAILGFLLVFKGTLDVVGSVMQKDVSELWLLGLIVGLLELLLGFWASQQNFTLNAVLILTWVGFAALFRGIGEVVMAFELRRVQRTLT
jgi:uncharacterized membrane protein HdeD (DUF308 family)